VLRRKLIAGGALIVLGLAAAACPEDEDTAPEQDEQAADGDTVQIDITATDYAFEVEETLEGGVVELTLTNDGDNAHEALLFQVPDDYDPEQFPEDFAGVEEGGPISDDFQTLVGVEAVEPGESSTETVTLPEGTYVLVCALSDDFQEMGEPGDEPGDGPAEGEDAADGANGDEAEDGAGEDAGAPNGDDDTAGAPADDEADDEDADDAAGEDADDAEGADDTDAEGADDAGEVDADPEDAGAEGRPAEGVAPEDAADPHYELGMLEPVSVEGGADITGADLPDEDGRIEMFDYGFELPELEAGSHTFALENTSDAEFHHAIVMGFPEGTDEEEAREAFDALVAADEEGGPPPEDTPEPEMVAGSPIFGPEVGGLFDVELESGRTYAFVCFIHDRAGGPPHAFAHDMVEFASVE
jgi:hypothetical protein